MSPNSPSYKGGYGPVRALRLIKLVAHVPVNEWLGLHFKVSSLVRTLRSRMYAKELKLAPYIV